VRRSQACNGSQLPLTIRLAAGAEAARIDFRCLDFFIINYQL
jgi:hypothetical protein